MSELVTVPVSPIPAQATSDAGMVEIWLRNYRSPHTRRRYPTDAASFFAFVGKPLGLVTVGDIQAFGMDPAGLRQMAIPTYIIVGAGDTTTPSSENAAFAARYIPNARLEVLPGPVNHEIFDNECDQIGRDNYPESCNDAPGVDRAKLHDYIGRAALTFFDKNLGVRRTPYSEKSP